MSPGMASRAAPRVLAPLMLLLACVAFLPAQMDPLPAGGTITLVSPEWVESHKDEIRILDVRQDPHRYLAGHVPGAVHLSESTLRGPLNGLPMQYLPLTIQADVLASAGVRDGSHVVVYSEGRDVLGATLVAYCLERLGHPRVMILDGGFEGYAKKLPTSQAYPVYRPGRFSPRLQQDLIVTLDEVAELLEEPGTVKVLDVRPAKAFRGEVKTWMRNGHIPGAINIPWRKLVDPGSPHLFRPVLEIQKLIEEHGLLPEDEILVTCGTGREATLGHFVLRHLLGYPYVRVYEGAWTEFAAHEALPVERGKAGEVSEEGIPGDPLRPRWWDMRGHDASTATTLEGRLCEVRRVGHDRPGRTGLHVSIHSNGGCIPVHLGRAAFVDRAPFKLKVGDHVVVVGSFTRDSGRPAIVASEITKGTRTFKLRKPDGTPLWRGRRRR